LVLYCKWRGAKVGDDGAVKGPSMKARFPDINLVADLRYGYVPVSGY
jgi:hypothetical protein